MQAAGGGAPPGVYAARQQGEDPFSSLTKPLLPHLWNKDIGPFPEMKFDDKYCVSEIIDFRKKTGNIVNTKRKSVITAKRPRGGCTQACFLELAKFSRPKPLSLQCMR